MPYLAPSEYAQYGLDEETLDALINSASAMIDAFCRRPSIAVQTYTERMRLTSNMQTIQVSALPLQSITSMCAYIRNGCELFQDPLQQAMSEFGLNNTWTNIDITTLDISPTGEVAIPQHLFGARFTEVKITYTAGFTEIPAAIKAACAQIVRNAQSTPALNVKRSSVSAMQLEYFSASLLDEDTKRLLTPYIATRMSA